MFTKLKLEQLIGTEICAYCHAQTECLSLANDLQACESCIRNAFSEYWGTKEPAITECEHIAVPSGNPCVVALRFTTPEQAQRFISSVISDVKRETKLRSKVETGEFDRW